MSFDLDAYLRRIAYDGPKPTLGVLGALHALHPATIAFDHALTIDTKS